MVALSRYIPDTPFVWVWDGDGETWRHRFMRENAYLYSKKQANTREPANPKKVVGYKANRRPKDESHIHKHKSKSSRFPSDSKSRGLLQIPVLRMVLDGLGFRSYQIPRLEADDLIAILCRYIVRHTDMGVIIHSGDKDFYQLMGERVKILSKIEKGKPLFVDDHDVKTKYKVSVRKWVQFRAWMGDPSDNIPHLYKIGPSAAAKMVNAGLDPALNLRDIDDSVAKKFARYFEPDGIVQCWPFAQSNYKLCKLISKYNDSRLPVEIQKEVKHLVRHLYFSRDKSRLNNETWRRVSHLLMHYELKSVLSRRDLLWRIP